MIKRVLKIQLRVVVPWWIGAGVFYSLFRWDK